jgi:hypothetical protein
MNRTRKLLEKNRTIGTILLSADVMDCGGRAKRRHRFRTERGFRKRRGAALPAALQDGSWPVSSSERNTELPMNRSAEHRLGARQDLEIFVPGRCPALQSGCSWPVSRSVRNKGLDMDPSPKRKPLAGELPPDNPFPARSAAAGNFCPIASRNQAKPLVLWPFLPLASALLNNSEDFA